jgi:hypothetical protein
MPCHAAPLGTIVRHHTGYGHVNGGDDWSPRVGGRAKTFTCWTAVFHIENIGHTTRCI